MKVRDLKDLESYENYPLKVILLSNLVAILIYAFGAYALAGFGILFPILYLLYGLWIEISVLRRSCIDCYYYDKICAFGKGRLCSLLFKKGDPKRFVEKEVSWLYILPDLMVPLFPLIGGLILLVRDFNTTIVAILVILSILFIAGNAVVRGSFACKYCRQRKLGCPAQKIFEKT